MDGHEPVRPRLFWAHCNLLLGPINSLRNEEEGGLGVHLNRAPQPNRRLLLCNLSMLDSDILLLFSGTNEQRGEGLEAEVQGDPAQSFKPSPLYVFVSALLAFITPIYLIGVKTSNFTISHNFTPIHSWDTNEDRLRGYFQNFGDVIEAVIMRDRATGRARGFGFVVFADPAVAERVVQEKHIIDGRNVEAKKAVPRDDQNNITRNPRSNSVSPGPSNIRTRKIFVGGLPSTSTESDFKRYFDQFGLITDVVVMYDHNTQRPRGFGFITFDTEDAVDRALYKTFHELKGKMVEIKRAIPKELSPGPNRSPLGSYSPGLSRVSSFVNGYGQGGYASSPVGNYGVRVDGRVSPGTIPTFVSLYGKGMHGEPNLNSSYGLNANFNPNLGYVKESNPLYDGISGRPANNGPTGNFGGASPLLSLARGGMWGTESLNFSANSGAFTGNIGSENSWIGPYESIGRLGGSSSNLSDGIVNGSKFSGGNYNSGSIDKRFPGSFQKNNAGIGVIGPPSSYAAPGGGYDVSLDLYENGLAYGDPTWGSSPSRVENSAPLSYGLGNANADVMTKSSAGYAG